MITITKEELAELKTYIGQLPTNQGMPLMNFLINKEQEQQTEVTDENE